MGVNVNKELGFSFFKYKKVHAILIGIVIFVILVRVLGVDFFLYGFKNKMHDYDLRINQMDEIMKDLCLSNIKSLMIIFFILRLKHGKMYKYIFIGLITTMTGILFLNIFNSCQTLVDCIAAICIYMPKYINCYIYVYVLERVEHFIDKYNQSNRFVEEVKAISMVVVIAISTVIIVSFAQAVLTVVII